MKKQLLAQLVAVIIGLAMTVSGVFAMSYEDAKKQDKPIVVMFHMHGCSACKDFAPTFDKFASKFADKFNFVKEDVHSSSLASTLKFDFVPAVFIIHPKTNKATRVSEQCAMDSGCFTKTLQNY